MRSCSPYRASTRLGEAAIACAIHDDPTRDPTPARELAAIGVERLAERLKRESPEEALAETMAGDLGLSGDLFTLEDPDNADVISVDATSTRRAREGSMVLNGMRACRGPARGPPSPPRQDGG